MKLVDTMEFRESSLFYSDLKGKFVISKHLIMQTIEVLRARKNQEELVFWAGRQLGELTIFLSVVAPKTERTAQSVFVSEKEAGIASKAARKNNVVILAQIHSHPGRYTWHSDGDDHLILFPYEGMLSIVVPSYGVNAEALSQFSVHQFQNGKWILCTQGSVEKNLQVTEELIDCREE